MLDRSMLVMFAVLLVSGCAGNADPVRQDKPPSARALFEDETSSHVLVVAHRACWAEGAPENSLAALSLCSGLGVEMAEIDVARTADGELVLMHDDTIDRMTDGTGRVEAHTLSRLREFRLRAGAGGPKAVLTNERIPTLREALRLAAERGILLNLDLKADVFGDSIALVRELGVEGKILTKLNIDPSDPRMRAVATRGQAMFMPIIRQCDGTGRPCSQTFASAVPQFQAVDPIAFEIVFSDAQFLAGGASAARRSGERVWVNTLTPNLAAGMTDAGALADPDTHWGRAIELGADIIQTDQPRQLIAYLELIGRRKLNLGNSPANAPA
jgi:glycerophosphoryl diester phosphodiesterase